MKGASVSLLMCIVIMAPGVTAAVIGGGIRNERSTSGSRQTGQKQVPTVEMQFQIMSPGELDDRLMPAGMIESREDMVVSAGSAGKIEKQNVEKGRFRRSFREDFTKAEAANRIYSATESLRNLLRQAFRTPHAESGAVMAK